MQKKLTLSRNRERIVFPLLVITVLFLIAIPVAANNPTYGPAWTPSDDHYVSFDLRANALAPNYAYDLVTRGEPGNNPWVYNIYMFGSDSSGLNGRVAVYGYTTGGYGLLSPTSPPLSTGQDYSIVWRYNTTRGGELFINGASQGSATGSGALDTTLSSSIHIGENMLPSPPPPARAHSTFNGQITNVFHWDRDLDGVVTPTPTPTPTSTTNTIPTATLTTTPTPTFTTNTTPTATLTATLTPTPSITSTTQVTTTVTTIITTNQTGTPTPTVTTNSTVVPTSTKSVNELLEEQNRKIEEQNRLIEEQNRKLAEQNTILDQIINAFKRLFGFK